MFGTQMTSSNKGKGTPMPFKTLRVWLFAIAALTVSGYGISIMFEILSSNGMTLLEYALLVLFSITFAWIVTAFCSGTIGFAPLRDRRLADQIIAVSVVFLDTRLIVWQKR